MTSPYIFEGTSFQVNTFFTNDQEQPKIAGLADGGYVITWMSSGQDLAGYKSLHAQRYAADGTSLGAEFQISTEVGHEEYQSVTGLADGGFVVVWRADYHDGGSMRGVKGQRYDANGNAVGAEFTTASGLAGEGAGSPHVTALSDGGFVVVFHQDGVPGESGAGMFGQRYDVSGIATGMRFHINTTTFGQQQEPTIAALENGGFVVTWKSQDVDGEFSWGLFGQRYDATGAKAGGEFMVNTTTAGQQMHQTITGYGDGGFVIFWTHSADVPVDPTLDEVITGQRYDADGAAIGGEFGVSTGQVHPDDASVVGLADGGFVVTWASQLTIFGQRFDANGDTVGDVFVINDAFSAQLRPDVTALANGGFSVTWQAGIDNDGDEYGIFAQQFAAQLFGTADGETIVDRVRANWIDGQDGDDLIKGKSGKDSLFGGAGDDMIFGGVRRDTLQGGTGNDTLDGGDHNDILKGQAGDDTLIGGKGKDTMTGGSGADTFVFRAANESATNANADIIKDFAIGTDVIDLLAFGATFIGTAGFSGAIEVRAVVSGGDTLVRVDVDGDGSADMKIVLEGVTGLTALDFIL